MAAQPPDLRSLQSWEEAFAHHPLPTIRTLERDLRKTLDENRSKLRSLVGASYRDLLGTAERIMEMDGQMGTLERGLGDMGRKCDARVLERVGRNWVGMRGEKGERHGGEEDGMVVVAQTKVLQGCLVVVGRVVKGRGDALLGAKVLVLARLLAKGIGESAQPPAVLEELRKKLAGLRRRLLGYLERSMTKVGMEKAALAGTLCAYALVTSSTPKEVLRHFLLVRFRLLESMADAPGEGEVMEMLDLYSQTLLDTKDLFPRRFADALAQLAKVPLLRDAQVYASHELSLDIYGQWIAEDVRSFTPWVRREQVTSSEVGDALASWTKQAHECLLAGLEECLEKQTDLAAVVESRHAVISKFMVLSSRLRNENHVDAINNIRETFLTRMRALVSTSAALPDLRLDVAAWDRQSLARKDSLWDLARNDMDLSNGAHSFRRSIVERRHGRDTSLDSEIARLDAWVKRIESSLDSIEHARTRKWDDDIEFDIDDLEDGDMLQDALSKQDPKAMIEDLSEDVEASVLDSFAKVQEWGESTKNAAYVLRVWRELDMRVKMLRNRLTFSPPTISLQALHRNLALATSRNAIDGYLQSLKSASHVATTLWDGTPPLPMQPGPATFRFLTTLHRAMSETGDDLWSAECVIELRKVVDERLSDALPSAGKEDSDLTNGHVENGEDEEGARNGAEAMKTSNRDRSLQSLFDQLCLQHVFHLPESQVNTSGLASSITELKQRAEIDQASQQRMEKSAREYWKRTYLLFGLLAGRARD